MIYSVTGMNPGYSLFFVMENGYVLKKYYKEAEGESDKTTFES